MEDAGERMWDPFREQDRLLRAAGEELRSHMDAFLRNLLSPEMLQALLSAMAGASSAPDPISSGGGIDPYRVLGLESTASDAEVKGRYRELLRRLHPDTAGVKGTEFLLRLVLAAYRRIGQERGWR